MIDTIKLHLSATYIPPNYLSFLKNKLDDKKTYETSEQKTYSGMFKNLKIIFNNQGFRLSNSLATYKFGTNQKTLTLFDLKQVIEELSDEFQLPLINSIVRRVDIAENIITKRSPELYNQTLESARYFKKHEILGGLGFQSSNRFLLFYNKSKQMKNEDITDVLNGKNVLRYEYRYLNQDTLSKFLNLSPVLMSNIMSNYWKLIDSWYDVFSTINKKQELVGFKPEVFTTPRSFRNQISILGIKELGGTEATIKIIENAKVEGVFNYPNGSTNLKNWVKTIMASPGLTEKSDLTTELEKKVKVIRFINNSDHLRAAHYSETGITN